MQIPFCGFYIKMPENFLYTQKSVVKRVSLHSHQTQYPKALFYQAKTSSSA